ncbi:MAG: carboxy terminal-processing peptidase, partial [Halomonadaceae bacterium]|nr:carboxy terminal-processing peptidase [Halomonadaceae bacterium]
VELARRMREEHTSVSLNREQRQREVEALDAEQLALENQRREALGLELLDELIDARLEETETEENDDEESVDQVQIDEAAAILADYAELTQQRLANRF